MRVVRQYAVPAEKAVSYTHLDIRLMLADGTEYPYEGLYDYKRKDVSSTPGTLVLVVMFPNPDRSLKPGQFARVEASVGPVRPRVVVPQACVSQAQGVNSVWVVPVSYTHLDARSAKFIGSCRAAARPKGGACADNPRYNKSDTSYILNSILCTETRTTPLAAGLPKPQSSHWNGGHRSGGTRATPTGSSNSRPAT